MVQTGCGGLLSTADVLTVPDSAGSVDADPRMSADAFLCCVPGTELSSYASQDYLRSRVLRAGGLWHRGLRQVSSGQHGTGHFTDVLWTASA